MRYGTDHEVSGDRAKVYTRPKQVDRTYVYPFHLCGDAWVLSRERDWYTEHALRYAEAWLDVPLVRRHLARDQEAITNYDTSQLYNIQGSRKSRKGSRRRS